MVRRQARGERRMREILDAALALFAEAGYEKTSTNAIAARAEISPGSLYQYFPNKEAIAHALSERLLSEMREAHATAFDPSTAAETPLPALIDRVIDPLVAFNVANPGAKVLIGAGTLAEAQPLHQAVTGRVAALITIKAPELTGEQVRRKSLVAVQIVAAVMPSIVAAPDPERAALVAELKKALLGYLTPGG